MKKFDLVVNKVFTNLLSEQEQPPAPGLDQTGGPQAQPAGGAPVVPAPAAPAPAPEPAPEQEPRRLTAPGRAFLVDLIRRALEIDPKPLDDADTGVFADDEVTIENAAEVEKKLVSIINRLNPSKIE